MFKFLKKILYTQIYINIISNAKETVVYTEELHHNGSSDNYEEVFNSTNKEDIYEYIQSIAKKSPVHYISILDNSPSYGAIPTCSQEDKKLHYNVSDFNNICTPNEWSYYTSKADLLELQGRYHKVGLDFVFSPFIILSNFFKDKIASDIAMYILINEDNLTLSIFENNKLLFALNLDMQNQDLDSSDELLMDIDDEELNLDDLASIDLENIDVDDDIESINEFDDIEDLDTFDEMEEFSQDMAEDENTLDEQSDFGVDYHRFSLIQSAVNNFYQDKQLESKFIEIVYIADSVGVNSELKKFLEEEMFLSVYIRKMDLTHELCELSKAEPK
ncbi:MAG: hypothetical protein L3I99_03150 [Sulfurimonas sp.]|nr:hypothetical protein [Sulfurimonas sp.]